MRFLSHICYCVCVCVTAECACEKPYRLRSTPLRFTKYNICFNRRSKNAHCSCVRSQNNARVCVCVCVCLVNGMRDLCVLMINRTHMASINTPSPFGVNKCELQSISSFAPSSNPRHHDGTDTQQQDQQHRQIALQATGVHAVRCRRADERQQTRRGHVRQLDDDHQFR